MVLRDAGFLDQMFDRFIDQEISSSRRLEFLKTANFLLHTASETLKFARAPCLGKAAAVAFEPGEAISFGQVTAKWCGAVLVVEAI